MALTNVQNEFLKMQLANNPEFQAEYFPNVITRPPTGPLYNVSAINPLIEKHKENLPYWWTPEEATKDVSPLAVYEKGKSFDMMPSAAMPKGPLHDIDPGSASFEGAEIGQFHDGKLGGVTGIPMHQLKAHYDYLSKESSPSKVAEFRKEHVPYDTKGSVIDIEPADRLYAYTQPWHMGAEIFDPQDPFGKKFTKIPVTEGQSSTLYMHPDMMADYGTPVTSPRGEMVNTPDWYPSNQDTTDQADINRFIVDILGHETAHNVNEMPGYKGITEAAENIDLSSLFPGISEEAKKATFQATQPYLPGGDIKPYKFFERDSLDLKKDLWPVTSKHTKEEIFNRATDMKKIKDQQDDWWNNELYWQNKNYIASVLRKYPHLGPKRNKTKKYLETIDPQATAYLTKVKEKAAKKKGPTITTAKGPPSILSRPKPKPYVSPARPHGNGGGGGQSGSMPTGTAGKNPWGRAHGGLIDIPLSGRRRDI